MLLLVSFRQIWEYDTSTSNKDGRPWDAVHGHSGLRDSL